MKTKIIIISSMIMVLIIFLAACTNNQVAGNVVAEQKTVKIGLSLPMTGTAASYGENALAGAKLAVKEINSKGGINGIPVEIILEDDECDAKTGATVYNKLSNIDKVNAIVGPLCSGVASSGLSLTKNTVNVIAMASLAELTTMGESIFRVYPSDAYQGKFAAEYIKKQSPNKKIAVFYTQNSWGQGIYNAFIKNSQGIDIQYKAGILENQMDFRLDLTKIKNKEINTIYFIGYPSNTIPFITQAKELGIKSKIITGDSSTSEEVLNLEISEGVIALLPRMELSDEFINKIKSIPEYKNLEVSISAAYTYDAMYTVFKAMEKGGDLKEEISKIEFKGITNDKISFDENGDLKNTAYQAQIIQNGKLVAIN